jgi:hypothetical protein
MSFPPRAVRDWGYLNYLIYDTYTSILVVLLRAGTSSRCGQIPGAAMTR